MYKQVQRFNNILVGWSVKTSKLLSTNSIRNHCFAQLPNFKSNLNYWIVIETLTFNLSTRYEIAWHFPIRHQAVTPKGTVGPHSTIDWIDLGIALAHNTVNATDVHMQKWLWHLLAIANGPMTTPDWKVILKTKGLDTHKSIALKA